MLFPSPSAASKRPNLPLCHLCGRQFGSSSLEIHLKECRKRYEREHGKPAPDLKTRTPTGALGSKAWAKFQETQEEGFREALEPCPHCGRTFLPDRLKVHLRSCGRTRHGGVECAPEAKADASPALRRPHLPMCHLCGRKFGSASLEIHMKECRKRYEREHGKPPPEPKMAPPTDRPITSKAWQDFNEAQDVGWNERLEPCPHCGRTFLPDRLVVHLRSCSRKLDLPSPSPSPSATFSASSSSAATSFPLDGARTARGGERAASPRGRRAGGASTERASPQRAPRRVAWPHDGATTERRAERAASPPHVESPQSDGAADRWADKPPSPRPQRPPLPPPPPDPTPKPPPRAEAPPPSSPPVSPLQPELPLGATRFPPYKGAPPNRPPSPPLSHREPSPPREGGARHGHLRAPLHASPHRAAASPRCHSARAPRPRSCSPPLRATSPARPSGRPGASASCEGARDAAKPEAQRSALERMNELRDLLHSQLITQGEFEEKRRQILEGI
ncbi:hypothetical protein AB1Y20_013576 [Prymnesium parvum]|uniref:C2HC/C3H-type domain-containing protein n=1 Tax=Prymnesium parvum TaxID=97485 RepID=A0AB34IJE0_PRYPA